MTSDSLRGASAVAVGGTAGYLRTRSTPSLVAGLGLGLSYACAGKSFLLHVIELLG
jgi:uncharacterized membrane protein (UPF0136 family)